MCTPRTTACSPLSGDASMHNVSMKPSGHPRPIARGLAASIWAPCPSNSNEKVVSTREALNTRVSQAKKQNRVPIPDPQSTKLIRPGGNWAVFEAIIKEDDQKCRELARPQAKKLDGMQLSVRETYSNSDEEVSQSVHIPSQDAVSIEIFASTEAVGSPSVTRPFPVIPSVPKANITHSGRHGKAACISTTAHPNETRQISSATHYNRSSHPHIPPSSNTSRHPLLPVSNNQAPRRQQSCPTTPASVGAWINFQHKITLSDKAALEDTRVKAKENEGKEVVFTTTYKDSKGHISQSVSAAVPGTIAAVHSAKPHHHQF